MLVSGYIQIISYYYVLISFNRLTNWHFAVFPCFLFPGLYYSSLNPTYNNLGRLDTLSRFYDICVREITFLLS